MTGKVERFFISLLTIQASTLMSWLFVSFVYFPVWLFIFFSCSFVGTLCIINIHHLSENIWMPLSSPHQWFLFVYGVLYNIQVFILV